MEETIGSKKEKHDVYLDALIEAMLPAFSENISQQDLDMLSKAFIEEIRLQYRDIAIDVANEACNGSEMTPEAFVKLFADVEIRSWKRLSVNGKKARLLIDDNLENIISLSNEMFALARDCAKKNTTINDENSFKAATKKIEDAYAKGVEPYNLERAKMELSEALVDINYAYGKSKAKSLRLSHYHY